MWGCLPSTSPPNERYAFNDNVTNLIQPGEFDDHSRNLAHGARACSQAIEAEVADFLGSSRFKDPGLPPTRRPPVTYRRASDYRYRPVPVRRACSRSRGGSCRPTHRFSPRCCRPIRRSIDRDAAADPYLKVLDRRLLRGTGGTARKDAADCRHPPSPPEAGWLTNTPWQGATVGERTSTSGRWHPFQPASKTKSVPLV